jgi:DNA repair protein RadC
MVGHRKRTKEKFLSTPPECTSDHDLLEMLLYLVYTRIDVKPMAKDILERYKTFRSFIMQSPEYNGKAQGNGQALPFVAKLIRECLLRVLDSVVQDWQEMVDYLRLRFCGTKKERFSVMYLDNSCKVLDVVEFGSGTINESTVYIREVIKVALEKGSTQIAICHNHVSDNVNPSAADIEITARIINACRMVNIRVADHIIVSPNDHFSFKANGLL